MKLMTIASTSFNNLKQRVIKMTGFKSTATAKEYGPFGIDSNPFKGMTAVYGKTDRDGSEVVIAYLIKDKIAEIGETRLFSTDDAGTLKTWIRLRNTGILELGGDQNFAVKYTELATEFNKLKTSVNNLITAFNAHTHLDPVSGALPPPTAVPGVIPATANTSDITQTKNANIKTV